jgi:hypothetical protein
MAFAERTLQTGMRMRVVWKSSQPEHDSEQDLLTAGFLHRQGRPALYCYGCDAVLLTPGTP